MNIRFIVFQFQIRILDYSRQSISNVLRKIGTRNQSFTIFLEGGMGWEDSEESDLSLLPIYRKKRSVRSRKLSPFNAPSPCHISSNLNNRNEQLNIRMCRSYFHKDIITKSQIE